ncbi:uncharacterized protein C8Q71DRAFT_842910 [Rhodofomes roseus]|uniref:F-box domain-containing protein n=1 Tax=Rhodofomes roseus TaxID=34475 RepID=A0ABQ8K110_9APHY|nr:uncharacterized protein C8Q71DRAFT_842910 [Rhodofomes roseus]KAH9830364.1 hypothetical protein C8Q71DRAFT_842910 [Rhodofomes roseus]
MHLSARTCRPRFPIEVSEHVLDFVWPDRTTLLSCTLVCRAWLPRARLNLLYEVRIRDTGQDRSLRSFISQYPSYCAVIRRLVISPKNSAAQSLLSSFPLELAHELAHIEYIRVLNNRRPFTYYAQSQSLAALTRWTSIRKLEIRGYTFSALQAFSRLIIAVPSVTSLVFESLRWTEAEWTPQEYLPVPTCFLPENIAMSDIRWSDAVVDMLIDLANPSSLHTLNLQAVTKQELPYVDRLIRTFGPALRHLVLGSVPTSWPPGTTLYPQLAENVNLQTLHLHFQARGEWIVPMLSQLARHVPPSSSFKKG